VRKFSIIFFFALALFSCENDDICLLNGTPKVIMTFYDADLPDVRKEVEDLTVYTNDYGVVYDRVTTDSISLDMNLNSELTSYHFDKNETDDVLDFSYVKEDVYVSRACGFKTTFYDFQALARSNNWIRSIEIINNEITDESQTTLHIFH